MLLYEKLVNHQILTRSHYTFIPVQDNAILLHSDPYKRENPRSISTSGTSLLKTATTYSPPCTQYLRRYEA